MLGVGIGTPSILGGGGGGGSGQIGATGATGPGGGGSGGGGTGPTGITGATGATGLAGATGPIAGSDTQVIFNRAGVAGATGVFTFNYTTGTLTTSALSVTNNASFTGTNTVSSLVVLYNASLQGVTTLSSLVVNNNAGVTGTANIGALTVTNATSMTGALNMNLCNISNVGTETFGSFVVQSSTNFITTHASLSPIAPNIITWIDCAFTANISSSSTTLNRVISRDATSTVFNPCGGGTITYGSRTLNGIPIISGITRSSFLESATNVTSAAGTKGLFAVFANADYSKLTYLYASSITGGLNAALVNGSFYMGASSVRNNIMTNAAIPSFIANSNVILAAINSSLLVSNVVTANGSGASLPTSDTIGNQQGSNYLSGTGKATIGASFEELGSTLTVAEVIVYDNTEITTTQRQLIEGYLAWKWGLTSQLPSIHPYSTTSPYGNPQATSFGSIAINSGSNVQISATSNIVLNPSGGNVTVSGALTTTGTATVSALFVTNNATFTGTNTVSSLVVSYNASLQGVTTMSSLVVNNNATISGNLTFPSVNVFTFSGTSLALTTASAGTYFYLSNSAFSNVSLPLPAPIMSGMFWTLRNATSSYLSVTVQNLTPSSILQSPLIMSPSNNSTIVYNVSGVNGATISGYILF